MDKITIEGPVEEVEAVRSSLQAAVDDLMSKLTYVDIVVEPKYHKHIIGKCGIDWDLGCGSLGLNCVHYCQLFV